MSMLASALPAEGEGGFAPGPPRRYPAAEKRYAALFAAWGKDCYWEAEVVEDDLGIRVVHLHNPGCSDGSCGVDTMRPSWTVADAVLLAEKKRDEMLAACLPYWGQPDSIDTVVEPTGDTERFEARIQAGPEPPRPPTAEADRAHGVSAAAGLAAVMALNVAPRSSFFVGWILAGLAVLGVALVALGWTVWQDRQVVRHWRRTLAEAREEQRERLTGHARRLRIRRSRITVSEIPQERAAR